MTQLNFKCSVEQPDISTFEIDGSRERFESRIRNSSFSNVAQWVLMRDEAGAYKDRQIQNRWEDWQLCEAASKSVIADLQAKLRDALNQNENPPDGALVNQAAAESLALLRQSLDQMKLSLDRNRIIEALPAPELPASIERD